MGGRILWEVVVSKRFSSLSIDWKKRPLRRSCGLAEFLCYWRYNMISDTTTHTRKSLFHEKRRIEEQASWRVSWSDSTAVSHYPSQNHFKMEKISTSRKFSRFLLPKIIARLREPCVLSNFFVIGDTTWFSIQPPPTRGKIVFTPPRNI